MITGFNTNVRHGSKVFHVQTEDSGRAHPHVISHLYHGGTILASVKCEYADLLELALDDVDGEIRALMESQHKTMVAGLRDGEFDAAIATRLDGAKPADAEADDTPQPASVDVPAPASAPAAAEESGARAFGEGIVSQKPLDEVILDYLVEKARDRAPEPSGDGPSKRSRVVRSKR